MLSVLACVLAQAGLGPSRTPVMPDAVTVRCVGDGGCASEAQVSRRLLEVRSDGLQRCWFSSNPKAEAAVTFSWRIAATGAVSDVAPREKVLPGALLTCFERELKAVPFPAAAAPAVAEATLALRPAGDLEDFSGDGRGPLTGWSLTLKDVSVTGPGDLGAMTRTVRRASKTLGACAAHFEAGGAKEPVAARATLTLDRSAKVSRSAVTGDLAAEVRECLEQRSSELRFPAAPGPTTVTFAIGFAPS